MYQFYYANKTQYDRVLCKKNIRDYFNITDVRPAVWEEHCLECSAPVCYKSCVHFKARSDGRCQLFKNGILTFTEEKANCGQGAHVEFKPWGNMMSVIFPDMIPEKKYLKIKKRNEILGRFLRGIVVVPLPHSVRWTVIRVFEGVRRRWLNRNKSKIKNKPDAFVFHGYSYQNEKFNLILEVCDFHTSICKTSITLNPGENVAVIQNLSLEFSQSGYRVRIYPEKNIEASLDILWCDFVRGKPILSEIPSDKVKCVVWDLDNTIWDGILIEANENTKLKLKDGVFEVISELDKRGIIQSIASKNDREPAIAMLKRLNITDYFLYPQIHWNPKSQSVIQIANNLNIGIDTLAFVDDSKFEREEVRSVCPQVRVYDATEIKSLLGKNEFNVPITIESQNRRAMYRTEEKRNTVMRSGKTDIVEFLRKCNFTVKLFPPKTDEEKLRCFELTVRTNQLNMSGKKYTFEEFENILTRPNHVNFAFECIDDFGEYGIVGYGQYRIEGDVLVFSEFAMSCRVSGKYVESALFSTLLHKTDCLSGCFEVNKTKKNSLLRRILETIGFETMEETEDHISYSFADKLLNSDVVKIEQD